MNSLYDKIHYWLTDYVDPDLLPSVSAMMYHIAVKHSKVSFGIGLALGFVAGIVVLRWAS